MFGPQASPVVQAQRTVAHRPDDVRLHLAQLRPLRERRVVERVEEGAELLERVVEPLASCTAQRCLCRQSRMHVSFCRGSTYVRNPPEGCRRLHPARHRGRESAFRVRERDEQLLLRAARLAQSPAGSSIVLAELDDERPDDRDRDHRCAGVRLLRPRPGLVVGRAARRRRRRGSRRAAPRSTRRRSFGATSPRAYSRPVTATVMDGKTPRGRIRAEVAAEVAAFPARSGSRPCSSATIRRRTSTSGASTRRRSRSGSRTRSAPARGDERGGAARPRRRAERRRRDRRDPRPAAAAGQIDEGA